MYPREIDMLMSQVSSRYLAAQEAIFRKTDPLMTQKDMDEQLRDVYAGIHESLQVSAAAGSQFPAERYKAYADALNETKPDNLAPYTADAVAAMIRRARMAWAGSNRPGYVNYNSVFYRGGSDQVNEKSAGAQKTESKNSMTTMNVNQKNNQPSRMSDMTTAPRANLSAGLDAGAIVSKQTELRYVPTLPQVSAVKTTETPCMYERIINDKNGQWLWRCKRTVVDGVNKCSLHRATDKTTELVPVTCLRQYIESVKGYDVQKITDTDDETGNSVSRTIVTPEIDTYSTIKRGKRLGPGIPFVPLRRVDEEGNVIPDQQFLLREDRNRVVDLSQRNLGGKSVKKGGASKAGAANAGAVNLPRPSTIKRKDFKLNELDLEDFQMNPSGDFMKEPASWKGLPSLSEDPNISFYAYDSDAYGVSRNAKRKDGFNFSFSYRPYSYLTEQSYLEWLVSILYKMRAEFPDYAISVYDPVLDTIRTVEDSILVALGRMEAAGVYFNRQKLFEGASSHHRVLHKYLKYYADEPPTPTWYSPLSGRYLQMSNEPNGAYPGERELAGNLQLLIGKITSLANDGLGIKDSNDVGIDIGLQSRFVDDMAVNRDKGFNDSQVMAILEDNLLSLLARLQFVHGYAINTLHPSVADQFREILSQSQRKFLSRELIQYVEAFSTEEETELFLRLPALRRKEAASLGIQVPKSTISNFVDKEFTSYSREIPKGLLATRTNLVTYNPPRIVSVINAGTGTNEKK